MSARGATAAPDEPPRVLVVVPTTGGPLHLRRLAPRPGLPHPAAFAEGDYRPLALSSDYRALAGPEGPVARRLGRALPPHELRLSGEPDGGRSWEAPVALAHLLLAGGGTLAADAEGAALLIWATGAVDLDLRLLPGDYALPRKVEASRALLEAAGDRRTVAVLPPGPGRDEAAAALASLRRAVPVEVVLADALGEGLARLQDPAPGTTAGPAAAARPVTRRAASRRWAATGLLTVAAWLAWAFLDRPAEVGEAVLIAVVEPGEGGPSVAPEPSGTAEPAAPEESTVPDPPPDPPAADPAPQPSDPAPDAPIPEVSDPPEAPPPAPAALIEAVRAAPGSSCRAALFDPGLRVLGPVPQEGAGYAALPLDPGLCGVTLRPALGGATLGPPRVDPPDAFVAAPAGGGPEGGVVLFLRGAPRNVVYAVPVLPEGGAPITVEHRLVAPGPPAGAPTE